MNPNQSNAIVHPSNISIASITKNLKNKLNFEFMDLDLMPSSLRSTLRDILEVGNGKPFRKYYQWTSTTIKDYADKNNIKEIVELGAGCAPITKHLLKNYPDWNINFKITDLNPDEINFRKIEQSDIRVKAIYEPLDFTKRMKGYEDSLLVLSATFHHVDEKHKRNILNNLKSLSPHVLIFEPLRPKISSILFVTAALISGLLTPLFNLKTKKFFRTFFWCWVLPVAPFLFLWDGWISALRCWSSKEWRQHEPNAEIQESLFCTKVQLGK